MSSVMISRRGVQVPRVSSFPESSGSLGELAVRLAASSGLVLDPWQASVLEGSMGERGRRWAAFEVCLLVPRQNGKGAVLTARELAGLFLLGEELIIHTAHVFSTAKEAYYRLKRIIQNTPDLHRLVKGSERGLDARGYRQSNDEVGIELKSGQRIRFMARTGAQGRGFSGDCVILDESMFLTSEQMAATLFLLSAASNAQLWYAGSAGMDVSEHLSTVRERGLVGDPALAYFEWSAEADANLDDRVAWAQANPALGFRLSDESIQRERNAMTGSEVQFARERLGIWSLQGHGAVIDPQVWGNLADRLPADDRPPLLDPVAFAVDVTPDRARATVAVAGLRGDGLPLVEVLDNSPGTGWVAERVAGLVEKWRPCAVVLDPSGPAGSLLPELDAAGVSVVTTSMREMGQACGAFYDAVSNGRLRHLGQPKLNVAVDRARKRKLGDAWAWHRQDSNTDLSPLVAVTLALFGHAKFGRAEPKTYEVFEF